MYAPLEIMGKISGNSQDYKNLIETFLQTTVAICDTNIYLNKLKNSMKLLVNMI